MVLSIGRNKILVLWTNLVKIQFSWQLGSNFNLATKTTNMFTFRKTTSKQALVTE